MSKVGLNNHLLVMTICSPIYAILKWGPHTCAQTWISTTLLFYTSSKSSFNLKRIKNFYVDLSNVSMKKLEDAKVSASFRQNIK